MTNLPKRIESALILVWLALMLCQNLPMEPRIQAHVEQVVNGIEVALMLIELFRK